MGGHQPPRSLLRLRPCVTRLYCRVNFQTVFIITIARYVICERYGPDTDTVMQVIRQYDENLKINAKDMFSRVVKKNVHGRMSNVLGRAAGDFVGVFYRCPVEGPDSGPLRGRSTVTNARSHGPDDLAFYIRAFLRAGRAQSITRCRRVPRTRKSGPLIRLKFGVLPSHSSAPTEFARSRTRRSPGF